MPQRGRSDSERLEAGLFWLAALAWASGRPLDEILNLALARYLQVATGGKWEQTR